MNAFDFSWSREWYDFLTTLCLFFVLNEIIVQLSYTRLDLPYVKYNMIFLERLK